MDRKAMIIALVTVAAIVVVAAVLVLPPAEEVDRTATINGTEYAYDEMVENFGTETVDGIEGVPLDAIIQDTNLTDPDTYSYVLEAEDGYAMVVNWTSLESGILAQVTEEDEDTGEDVTYLMTKFPDLPGSYSIKYLAGIEPKTGLSMFACNGLEFYLDYMPKRVNEKTVSYAKNDEVFNYTGYSLSDMVNYTGLENPDSYDYTVVGYEAGAEEPWHNQTVSWDGMMGGVIVDEEVKVVFDDTSGYGSGKYRVKFVIEIIVE